MKFSFVVPSIGDKDQKLRDCIESIETAYDREKDIDIEILVIIQNSKNSIFNIKTRHPGLFAFYYIDGKGLSRSRNYAIRKSRGDFLVFLDDDARIREDYLGALRKACLMSGADALCGRILEKDTGSYFASCFARDKKKYLRRNEFRYFMGSSHVIKKDTIGKIGYYDEKFGAGAKYPAAEESDMFFRMKHRNMRVLYCPDLAVFHPISRDTDFSKVFDYSYAGGAMLAKQILQDRKHVFAYLAIIAGIMSKCFIRSLQVIFFRKGIELKNARFRYGAVLRGVPRGIIDYVKEGAGNRNRVTYENRD